MILFGFLVISMERSVDAEDIHINDDGDADNDHDNSTVYYENEPLINAVETRPHSLSILINTKEFRADTMIRLQYERVPLHRDSLFMQHLDDPVVEYFPLTMRMQTHNLTELPKGKYIVCGEALLRGEVEQANCFEIMIERFNNNSEFDDERL